MFGQGQLICTLPHQNSWNGTFLDSMGLNKSLDFCKNIRLIIRLKRNIRIDYSFSYRGDPNSQIHYSVWYKRNPNNSNSIRFIPKGIIRFLINSYSAELFVFGWALLWHLSDSLSKKLWSLSHPSDEDPSWKGPPPTQKLKKKNKCVLNWL